MKGNFWGTLHFERENFKSPFYMKYKQPFKFIPGSTLKYTNKVDGF